MVMLNTRGHNLRKTIVARARRDGRLAFSPPGHKTLHVPHLIGRFGGAPTLSQNGYCHGRKENETVTWVKTCRKNAVTRMQLK